MTMGVPDVERSALMAADLRLDTLAAVRAVADRAAAEGSSVVALTAVYQALGVDQPHHLTVHADRWTLTCGCMEGQCHIAPYVSRAPLLSSPHAYGRTYEVWPDPDGALRFREVQPT